MINEQWVLIADTTNAFFPLIAQLPDRDMSGDDQAHLGAVHAQKNCVLLLYTLWVCGNGFFYFPLDASFLF
jgi:hypothetical protein